MSEQYEEAGLSQRFIEATAMRLLGKQVRNTADTARPFTLAHSHPPLTPAHSHPPLHTPFHSHLPMHTFPSTTCHSHLPIHTSSSTPPHSHLLIHTRRSSWARPICWMRSTSSREGGVPRSGEVSQQASSAQTRSMPSREGRALALGRGLPLSPPRVETPFAPWARRDAAGGAARLGGGGLGGSA